MSSTIHNVNPLSSRFTKSPRVAVIDNFKRQYVDIDGDGVVDKISHGDIVSLILGAKTPAELISFDTGGSVETAVNAFKEIKQNNISGNMFHAVNISLSDKLYVDMYKLRKLTGLALTLNNLVENKRKILDILRKKPLFEEDIKIIAEIEKLIETGSKVFVAAGNNGIYGVNLFSLIEGVCTVGATNARGDIEPYSPITSLVDVYEQGTHNVTAVVADQEVAGYSIVNHENIEIPPEKVSGEKSPCNKPLINLNDTISTQCLPLKLWTVYPVRILKQEITDLISEVAKHIPFFQKPTDELGLIIMRDFSIQREFGGISQLVLLLNSLDEKNNNEYIVFKYLPTNIHQGILYYLKRDCKGNFIYDPDCSGRKAISFIQGTSLATPIAVSKYLNAI